MDRIKPTQLLARYEIPVVISAMCFLFAMSSDLYQLLAYDRVNINNGEYWRLVTGNFLHSNLTHMLLNIGGLWLIWLIFWDLGSRLWQWLFLLFPVTINTLLLYILNPSMIEYVGLSGALHGTIVAFGLADIKKNKWVSIGLLMGVSIKLGHEVLNGGSELVTKLIEVNVAVDAHLYGAVSGLMIGGVYLLLHFSSAIKPSE